MKYCIHLSIAILIVIGMSCQKDVGFKNIETDFQADLFIEGILYPDEIAKIYVSHSLPFINEKVTPQEIFVRQAVVELSTSTHSEILQIDSTFDKFRCRWSLFYAGDTPVQYGASYELTVRHQGQTYRGRTTIDQSPINIESVVYTPEFFDVYGGHDGVIIRLNDIPGESNHYRFQMDRMIDNTRLHAHVLDVITSTCTGDGETFLVTDLGRTIFSDGQLDGKSLELYIEVSFEYLEGDEATIYMQSLDSKSAAFFKELDEQLQSILNPFVEPVFLHSNIEGTLGVFGSAVRSQPVHFVYPQDNP